MTTDSITQLLKKWQKGEVHAEQLLYEKILPILRKQARMIRNDHHGKVELDTTEVMHEAYLKLDEIKQLSFNDHAHFYAISAKVIRHLVIDHMRKQSSKKRGGRIPLVSLDEVSQLPIQSFDPSVDWLALERALNELYVVDPMCGRIVEMKIFSAMTLEEMSQVCQCSIMTVRRKWRFAKAWLTAQLNDT